MDMNYERKILQERMANQGHKILAWHPANRAVIEIAHRHHKFRNAERERLIPRETVAMKRKGVKSSHNNIQPTMTAREWMTCMKHWKNKMRNSSRSR